MCTVGTHKYASTHKVHTSEPSKSTPVRTQMFVQYNPIERERLKASEGVRTRAEKRRVPANYLAIKSALCVVAFILGCCCSRNVLAARRVHFMVGGHTTEPASHHHGFVMRVRALHPTQQATQPFRRQRRHSEHRSASPRAHRRHRVINCDLSYRIVKRRRSNHLAGNYKKITADIK